MKLLLDANISWRLVTVLKEHFGECIHVDNIPELDFPARDTAIWQYAKDNGYTVITRDNDFSDLISIKGFPPKIILLRTGNCSRKFTADLLIRSKLAIEELLKVEGYGLLEIF
jgi:predicted nuclease of predicted toxin-antitoxin system